MQVHTVEAVVLGCSPGHDQEANDLFPASVAAALEGYGARDAAVVFYPQEKELGIVAQWKGRSNAQVLKEFDNAFWGLSELEYLLPTTAYLGKVLVREETWVSSFLASVVPALRRLIGWLSGAPMRSVWR